jgi:tetratricopeptide (TPR) repeat protein
VALVALAGGAAWWYFRPQKPDPQPPAVDLSHAEPEVRQAIQAASDKARAAPRDAATWGKLGMLLLAHDFQAESRAAFRTAAELDPADYRWPYLEGLTLVLREPEAGLDRLRRAAELAPANRPEPRLRLAELLTERGDLDGAAALAQGVVAAGGENSRAELILARVAAARGDWPGVLDRTARCGSDPAARREATLLRGRALEATGRRYDADAAFRAAAELPEPPPWPDPAVKDVESLRVGVKELLARAGALLDQGRAGEAAELAGALTARAPDNPQPALLQGKALVEFGDFPAARTALEKHVARFPSSVEGWFSLGVARFQTGDVRGAADAFGRAVKLKPDHALAHFNLGHCHRRLGDRKAAKAEYEEALRCRPDYRAAREALADLEAGKP